MCWIDATVHSSYLRHNFLPYPWHRLPDPAHFLSSKKEPFELLQFMWSHRENFISLEAAEANRSIPHCESSNWIEIPVWTPGSCPLPQTNGMLWKTSVSCHGSPLVQHPVFFPLFHGYRGELWYLRAIIIFQQHRYTQVQTEILITGEYFFAILERAYHDEFWLRDDHIQGWQV